MARTKAHPIVLAPEEQETSERAVRGRTVAHRTAQRSRLLLVATANPLYGAILLAVYGLGRVLPAVALGALIVAGTDRRKVSQGMTSFRERTNWLTNGMLAAMGSYLIVLFGGAVLYRTLTL